MGMYTDFALKFSIEKNNKDFDYILSVLAHVSGVDVRTPPVEMPDHPFFQTSRCDMMARSGRSFIVNQDYMSWVDVMLIGEFKNYENEIAHFINWISPHLYDNLTGYSHYEGSEHTVPYFVESAESAR